MGYDLRRYLDYMERKEEAKEASSVFEEIKIGLQEAIDGDIYRENTLSTDESEENNG